MKSHWIKQLFEKAIHILVSILMMSLFCCFALANESCLGFYRKNPTGAIEVKDTHVNIGTEMFTVVDVLEGMHGGKRYIVETKGAWHENIKDFSEDGGDIVQDLRLYATVLGKKAARFFGYEVLNRDHVIVPSVTELSNALKKFNDSLPENDPRKILVGVYPTTAGLVGAKTYRYEFIENSRIPVSLKKRHYFHDIAGHALQGFFIPNIITSTLRKRLGVLEKFADQIQGRFPESADKIFEYIGRLIDTYSNFANFSLKAEIKSNLGTLGQETFKKSEIAKAAKASTDLHKLWRRYQAWDSSAINAKTLEYFHIKDTSTGGGIDKYSERFKFLNEKFEKVLDFFIKENGTPFFRETSLEVQEYLTKLPQELKFELEQDLSGVFSRMEQARKKADILNKRTWGDRIKRFLVRGRAVESLTPEEAVIQQRIEHAERLMDQLF